MIKPEEVPALTAALARSVDQRAADLAILLNNQVYEDELSRTLGAAGPAAATRALQHLIRAERELRELAAVLESATMKQADHD